MKYILHCILAICFFITAPGCTPDAPQPQTKAAVQKAAPKKIKKKKPALDSAAEKDAQKDKEEYSYVSAGKPDPFRPLLVDSPVKVKASRNTDFLTPLQKYDLADLKLVAVVVTDGEPTAMLEDPTGYGYVVRKGAFVGPNEGVVERVIPTGLVIKEKMYTAEGDVEIKISTITIQHVE